MPAAPDSRAHRLAEALAERELDALLVGDLVAPADSSREAMADLSWLTGFRGTSGLGVVSERERLFFTDFRYVARAERTLPGSFELLRAESSLIDAAAERLEGRVGFDEEKTSVKVRDELAAKTADGVELVPSGGILGELRRRKDETEIEAIAAAMALADEVLAELEQAGLAGRRERDVAVWIEQRLRELGAEGPSFAPIVAAGPNGALPHAEPSAREIGAGELVVVDMGALLDGYCSDCTRTYASGEPGERAREIYEIVQKAQLGGLDAVGPGVGGREADAAVRELITEAGYGENFGHGLGHGVGIEVHESPRLSKRSEETLVEGDVVSVEPGIYLEGELGVRIEDLVAITADGARNLAGRPKELLIVG